MKRPSWYPRLWLIDPQPTRSHACRPRLEALEDRTLLSTLVIDPKNLVISAAATGLTAQYNLADPAGGGAFGSQVVPLPNGNVVVTDPALNNSAGAVYLFNGKSGALISTLSGSAGDSVGSRGITVLANGNFVVSSPYWGGAAGALTWGSGMFGVSGVVSAANSLVGSHPYDYVGLSYGRPSADVTPLTNGNYVVASPEWNGQLGAVTWGDGTTGVVGVVSAANSLVGSIPSDQVGYGTGFPRLNHGVYVYDTGVTALANGNYVVDSPAWSNSLGAVTWGNGTTGVTGTVSAANSLVGTIAYDYIGGFGVTALTNGNYVVQSINWNNNRGAATWGNGTTGIVGAVTAANSLVGTNPSPAGSTNGGDIVGGYVTPLANGNYVVISSAWNGSLGAVTWGNGTTGVTGAVSPTNSLVGTASGDQIGVGGVTALTNGNYVVSSPAWNAETSAVTWGNGNTGVVGPVSAANSLVGGNAGIGFFQVAVQAVTALTNGNYVVSSPQWNNYRGAVTWANGSTGTIGTISPANSLVGTTPGFTTGGDRVGSGTFSFSMPNGVTPLANGNYVVTSPLWNGAMGAATWGDGITGSVGTVSAANSLVGAAGSDQVGSGGVTPLPNGNYVVGSSQWNGQIGAATWGNGGTGTVGTVSAANSLVGSAASDQVGASVTALTNGNYVVATATWGGGRGSASWGSGAGGVVGTVSAANSLVGSTPNAGGGTGGDAVGSGGVTPLPNGNYVVVSPNWNAARGAATWADGSSGLTLDGQNTVDALNSLVGAGPNAGLTAVVPGPVPGAFLATFASENGGRVTVGAPVTGSLTFGLFADLTLTVSPTFLTAMLNAGTNVVVHANNDITVSDPIVAAPSGAAGNLTLDAGRSIFLDASIATAGGNLSLIANDTVADGVVDADRDPGNASIDMLSGATLNTGSGTLAIDLKNSTDKTNNGHGAAMLTKLTAPSTTLSSTTTLGSVLNGTTPGDGVAAGTYTQLSVTSPLSLNGIGLLVTHTPVGATAGNTFTIVHTTGGVTGIFAGLAEGATVTAPDGSQFTISYLANGGDDVTLTAITPPGFSYDAVSKVLTITGSAATNTFTYFQGSAVYGSGTLQTTCDFTLNGATIAYPLSQLADVRVNAEGSGNRAVFITNDTYVGSDGQTHETLEDAVLGPSGGSLNKPNAAGTFQVFLLLTGFATSYAYVGHADTAELVGVHDPGNLQNTFVTAGNYSYIYGGGEFHLVSGARYVYGYKVNPADQAWQYDAAGSLDAFVASGNAYTYMSGTDTNGNSFFNVAVGFQVNYGIATHGDAIAYMLDSPGNDVFVGYAPYSYMSGSDANGPLFNVAEGFALVFAQSFVGGTDYAYNFDPSHNILNSRWILLT